jgi:hypothetical protein
VEMLRVAMSGDVFARHAHNWLIGMLPPAEPAQFLPAPSRRSAPGGAMFHVTLRNEPRAEQLARRRRSGWPPVSSAGGYRSRHA